MKRIGLPVIVANDNLDTELNRVKEGHRVDPPVRDGETRPKYVQMKGSEMGMTKKHTTYIAGCTIRMPPC
jgi:hypothetical protein